MAYNGGFPVTYPQLYPQFPTYQPMQAIQPQPVQQQGMTPPTVHADIVQVSSEAEAAAYPVAAGASQMMVAKDDSAIFVKTAYPNGQSALEVFVKRPPEPAPKPVDLTAYVTREELEQRLAALSPRKAKREETTE